MKNLNKNNRLHLEIQTHRANPYGLIRSTYRENGKIKHQMHSRISGVDIDTLKLIQAALQGDVVLKSDFKILSSKEYGASYACHQLAKNLGLDKAIYSRTNESWVKDCLAMIVGRLVYAGSKLSLSKVTKDSSLWEICGISDSQIDVDVHCYDAMDRLIERQDDIQKHLAKKHLDNNTMIFYDITSSYLEGEYDESEIVKFGYNRDQKKGHEQIVIGLLCNKDGCPISVEVFRGNTKDESTVLGKVSEIKKKYNIENAVFVGDRGMVTKANFDKIENDDYIRTISALTHNQIRTLCNTEKTQLSMFDEKNIIETTDGKLRYALCKNPDVEAKTKNQRVALLSKTEEALNKIANSTQKATSEKIGIRIGKVLNRYKMGKFVELTIVDNNFTWSFNSEKIKNEALFDGCYVISTDVSAEEMTIVEVVKNYKKLIQVEQAFRSLKTTRLEIRPIYHKKDERIKCHVFICMLAFYLMWNMKKMLKSLFENGGIGKDREYTFDYIIERLKSIRNESVDFNGIKSNVITERDSNQEHILNLLNVKM